MASKLNRTRLRDGFALILVLAALSLTAIIILAFFLSVTSDLNTSKSFANNSSTKALADDVVQLVQSQIADATTQPIDSTGAVYDYSSTSKSFAWASQPGMIRTYKNDGSGLMFYKLYSSDSMRTVWNNQTGYTAGTQDDLKAADVADPAQFTDLNSPVTSAAGGLVYPIVNPSALISNNPTSGVQGFSVSGQPTSVAGVNTSNGATSIPMPVRWLYVLQNGQLVAAPSGGTTGTAIIAGATAANPIIGRVAFWTDDETSKVNINTAGEGTFWDTPRFWGTSQGSTTPNPALTGLPSYPDPEYAFAMSQPVQYEFQRYPGHPAQVALSPIFPQLLTQYTTPQTLANAMSSVTPFLATGGSEGGTLTIDSPPANLNASGVLDLTTAVRKSPYASVDEFLYGTGALSGSKRPATDTTGAVITNNTINSAKFFVTADSRAPELNLFGKPRIACWPISKDLNLTSNPNSPYTSVYDRLIAFCSSLKTGATTYSPYYFQRWEPNDPAYDYSDPSMARNKSLYTYLQSLTGQAIPGFGGNFLTKYPGQGGTSDRDQILTEIFDYVRCTDQSDPLLTNHSAPNPYQYVYASAVSANGYNNNANVVYPITPIQVGSTMGLGRNAAFNQVGICVTCLLDSSKLVLSSNGRVVRDTTTGPHNPGYNGVNANTGQYPIQVMVPTTPPSGDYPTGLVDSYDYDPVMTAAGQNPLSYKFPYPNNGTGAKPAVYLFQAAIVLEASQLAFGPPDLDPVHYMTVTGLNNVQIAGNNGGYTGNPFQVASSGFSPPPATDQIFCTQWYQGTGIVSGPELFPNVFADDHNQYYSSGGVVCMPRNLGTYNYTTNVPVSGQPFYYPLVSQPFLVNSATDTGLKISTPTTSDVAINLYTGPTTNGKSTGPSGLALTSVYNGTAGACGSIYQTISFGFPATGTYQAMGLPFPTLDVDDIKPNPIPPPPLTPTEIITTANWWGFPQRIDNTVSVDLFTTYDSVKSFFLTNHGDWRLLAARQNAQATPTPMSISSSGTLSFAGYPDVTSAYNFFEHLINTEHYGGLMLSGNASTATWAQACSLIPGLTTKYPSYDKNLHTPVTPWSGDPPSPTDTSLGQNCYKNGDFDNYNAFWQDGPGINKPDEVDSGGAAANKTIPYVSGYLTDTVMRGATFYTPNRIIPSAGMFGSLPTGVISGTPWQTLLFRPQPSITGTVSNYYAHSQSVTPDGGSTTSYYNQYTAGGKPPDHLFMDLFWMPIVEPYAISDTFSTAGKINMNYQIQPFTYIDRTTPLVCLLKNEKMSAVPDSASTWYKGSPGTEPAAGTNIFRFGINPTEPSVAGQPGGSLRQFMARFAVGDIFRSATEICDIFLVPQDTNGGNTINWQNDTDAATFWSTHRLTGDNSRERPYTNLYARLTTKSNTFTVHLRVQSIKQSPADRAAGKWVEGTDVVMGEYRGSALVERYLDPNYNSTSTVTDYAANVSATGNLDAYYKFRVDKTTQFNP